MTRITRTYTAPSHWAPYLINGDATGLDDIDQEAADMFVNEVGCGAPVGCEDAGFVSFPDFGGFAADCQTYTFFEEVLS